eukprot:TRINITY_DN47488_c0_g1_i1.p1 TRINITY_DN47488_c0_g1~~TRINITY_DN47488_c0_g1_i1.p1  ORF type:complete len:586 (+),score=76.77 TRINITY_DN47488_c0_g1_i1:129-1886(+)
MVSMSSMLVAPTLILVYLCLEAHAGIARTASRISAPSMRSRRLESSPGSTIATSLKTDLCDRVAAVSNGSMALEDGLRGVTIHGAVTFWDEALVSVDENGEWSGLHYEIMTELANRAGFSFELHQHQKPVDMGWSDWLYETISLYDISVEYWLPTPTRMQKGAFPAFGIVDTSTQFAAHRKPEEKSVQWLSFLSPLGLEVWIIFVMLAAVTAAAYLFAEWNAEGTDLGDETADKIYNSLFFSFITVTGASTMTPRTWGGKLISWSWAWCVLLFVSAYTANLAAVLIVKAPNTQKFNSLEEALASSKSICVWKGTPQEEYLEMYIENYFPAYKHMRQTNKHPMQALYDGDCDGALGARIEVEIGAETMQMNPCCSLGTIGNDLTLTEGAWMVGNDYEKCSMLVRDVLYLHATAVKGTGMLDDIYNTYVSRKSDQHCYSEEVIKARCPDGVTLKERRLKAKSKGGVAGAAATAEGAGESSEDQDALRIDAMAGMFLIHFVFLILGGMPRAFKMAKKYREDQQQVVPCSDVGDTSPSGDTGPSGDDAQQKAVTEHEQVVEIVVPKSLWQTSQPGAVEEKDDPLQPIVK